MLRNAFTLLVLALAVALVSASSSSYKYSQNFATKTAYWDQTKALSSSDKALAKKFTLRQVQAVARHGARFPTTSNTQEVMDLLANLQTNYSSVIPAWMRNYSLPYNLTVQGNLATAGATNLKNYGTRMRSRIGSLLPTSFNSSNYIMQHTYKSRCKDSAIAFASTFFSNPSSVTYTAYTSTYDPLLRFYDMCARYNTEVADNATAIEQVTLYAETKRMVNTISTLRAKLNLPANASLTVDNVATAYSACSFDLALYSTTSNWCSLLDKDLIYAHEYSEDIETYYQQGPGYKINYEIASVLLKDIVANMTNFAAGNGSVVGNFRFAHAETTLPLMVLMGFGNSSALLASASEKQILDRCFRSSALAPLAANIEFQLLQENASGEYYVQVLVNEQPTKVPGCSSLYCKLSTLTTHWSYYLNTYNFTAECAE